MAVSKTITGTTNVPNLWTYKIVVTEASTDVANRTSTIKVEHYLGRKSGAGSSYFQGSYTIKSVVNGTTQTSNKTANKTTVGDGGWKSIGSHTYTVSNTGNPTNITVSGQQTSSAFSPSSSSASGNVDLTILHIPPEITDVTSSELNAQLTSIGIINQLVSLLSEKKYTITASANDGATITTYNVYNNGVLIGTSNSNEVIVDFSTVTIGNEGVIRFEVIDSMGGTQFQEWQYPQIVYTKPSLNQATSIKRRSDSTYGIIDGHAYLNINGNFYAEDNIIGNNNTIIKVEYKIWNTTEPSYTDVTASATISDGSVTITNYDISSIDFDKIYTYKMVITDYFGNTSEVKIGTVPTGLAIFSEYKDHVDFYGLTKQNIPVTVPYSLFTDAVGSSSTIQLSDDISNYQFIEIYFYYAIDDYTLYSNYVKEYDADGKTITLSASYDNGTYLYHEVARYIASGTTITKDTSARWRMATGGANSTRTDTTSGGSSLRINKVIGYK